MITMAAPIFFVLALVFMLFVRRGEAKTGTAG